MEDRGKGRTAFYCDMALTLDIPMQWNSTLDMLITLAQMKQPIAKLKIIAKREKLDVHSQARYLFDQE